MTHLNIYSTLFILLFGISSYSQDVIYSFANAQNTNDGTADYYEVDVLAESTVEFEMGSGQIYINYNTAAFGSNIHASGALTITQPSGSILATEAFAGFDFYDSFVQNDNTTDRFSFSWQQAGFSSGCLGGNNITATPTVLFHVKVEYEDVGALSNFCFEDGALFDDQTYTACGPTGACSGKNCATGGIHLTNDNFVCSGAVLPLELMDFKVQPQNSAFHIRWTTFDEVNFQGFELQRTDSKMDFQTIHWTEGRGGDWEQNYTYQDRSIEANTRYFYRLKMLDVDGHFEYSPIRSAIILDDANQTSIYPNPVRDELTIATFPEATNALFIRDVHGKIVWSKRNLTHQTEPMKLNLESLAEGIYFLQLVGDLKTVSLKFVKGN